MHQLPNIYIYTLETETIVYYKFEKVIYSSTFQNYI